jgi:hypothetical protein
VLAVARDFSLKGIFVAAALIAALPAWAEGQDPPGPDPLRVSLTTGFSHRNATYSESGQQDLSYSGLTPPPYVRLSAAWLFLKYVGVGVDGFGEFFSVKPRAGPDTPLGSVKYAYTWSGSLGVVGRLAPAAFISLELQAGWAFRGETQVKQDDDGRLTDNPVAHQGPYGTFAVGVHPYQFPVAFLAWFRASPPVGVGNVGESFRDATSWWLSAGAEADIGRLKLSTMRISLALQYEFNLRRSTSASNGWIDRVHNIGLGVRVAMAGPPVYTEEQQPTKSEPSSLSGRVTDEAGAPIWKAKVKVNGGAPLETDAQGQFKVADITSGDVSVEATAEGFRPTTITVPVAAGEQATVKVAMKRPTGPGKLKGKVFFTDPERPAAGAEIALEGGRTVTTAEDGSYVLNNVGPGPVAIKVSATGYVAAEEMVQVPAEAETTLDVKLSNKKPNALLRGRITVKEGALISATVTVKQKKVTVQVGADGRFNIELPGGRYDIVVEAPGYQTQTRTIDVGYGDQTIYHFELRSKAR